MTGTFPSPSPSRSTQIVFPVPIEIAACGAADTGALVEGTIAIAKPEINGKYSINHQIPLAISGEVKRLQQKVSDSV